MTLLSRTKTVPAQILPALFALLTATLVIPPPLPAQPSPATAQVSHILPQPRELSHPTSHLLSQGVTIRSESQNPDDLFAAEDLRATLTARHVPAAQPSGKPFEIRLFRLPSAPAEALLHGSAITFDPAMQAEGYVLAPTETGIAIIAASSEGLFYGCQTIKQMLSGSGPTAALLTRNRQGLARHALARR